MISCEWQAESSLIKEDMLVILFLWKASKRVTELHDTNIFQISISGARATAIIGKTLKSQSMCYFQEGQRIQTRASTFPLRSAGIG